MKKIDQIIALTLLIFAVGFNLWIYRLEPTAQIDPNDNTFQFALVYRTNQIWDFADKKCSGNILTLPICHFSYLVDHWVPNWNEGYNLPFYYSHIPQILMVGSYRILNFLSPVPFSLFAYYHFVIYLLLCLFPLSVFMALRVSGMSWLVAGFGALLASHISTDGFYGLDPSSFLWRGYGLSSQLFAMIWLPIAVAYSIRSFTNKRFIVPAILFLVLTTAGHIGIGIMAFLSLIPLGLAAPVGRFLLRQPLKEIIAPIKENAIIISVISLASICILSYWLVPALLGDIFHNFSFWDPVWKFDSYGAKEVMARLINGALFDFGRLPVVTGLTVVGIFVVVQTGSSNFLGLALMFIFFLALYFGRTTWGNLINIIPAMREFHLSRFIVGVHLAGLFLAPIGMEWIICRLSKKFLIPYSLFLILLLIPIIAFVYPQTARYAAHNDTLITKANGTYAKQAAGAEILTSTLFQLQKTTGQPDGRHGRVFAGRAAWGHDFRIAETPLYMYLSNFGIPTVLWLPETWSPNGDTEQYFREDHEEDYALYNIKYIVTPADLPKTNIQPFWSQIKEDSWWKLYEVRKVSTVSKVSSVKIIDTSDTFDTFDTSSFGYFTAGVRPAILAADKYSRTNVIRLWIQSGDPKNGLYPELSFDTEKYPINVGLPNFKMLDEVTFQVPGGSIHNIFAEPPRYLPPSGNQQFKKITIKDERVDTDMIFSARVSVPEDCLECLIILKETYHPNWRVTVDGKSITPIITFPFFIGIPVTAGVHSIVASYEPSILKVFLLVVTGMALAGVGIFVLKNKINKNSLKL